MSATDKFTPGSPEQPGFYERCRALVRVVTTPLYRLETEGLANIPATGPAILASNHLSFWDITSVAVRSRRLMHFMAKAEYAESRLADWVFTNLEAFYVRRGEGDMDAIRNALAVLKAGQLLFIYPEGHRSEDHAMIPAHEGLALIAYKSGAPVIPIATWGSEFVGKGGRIGPWRPVVHVRYGAPLTFTPAGKRASREELQTGTDTIMRAIAAMLPSHYRGVYGDATAAPVPITTGPATTPETVQ